MFTNKYSQIKETTVEEEKKRQRNKRLREILKEINLQVINEDDGFEVCAEIFTK